MKELSIGIIGGVDGPTAVFVGGDIAGTAVLAVSVVLAAALIVWFVVRKRKTK